MDPFEQIVVRPFYWEFFLILGLFSIHFHYVLENQASIKMKNGLTKQSACWWPPTATTGC